MEAVLAAHPDAARAENNVRGCGRAPPHAPRACTRRACAICPLSHALLSHARRAQDGNLPKDVVRYNFTLDSATKDAFERTLLW
jgi:hypothetical protein